MSPALFLDRDGVVNVDAGYVHRVEDFQFVSGIFDVCRAALERGLLIFIVTNQAGIARGLYTPRDYRVLTQWMLGQFRERAIVISKVYHCPYHPEHGIGRYRRASSMRKPAPGMINKARSEFDLDLQSSVLIGDKATDIAAGKAAGVGTNILLRGGDGTVCADADWSARNLAEIAEWLGNGRRSWTQ